MICMGMPIHYMCCLECKLTYLQNNVILYITYVYIYIYISVCVLCIILYLCIRLVTSIIVHQLPGGLSGNAGLQSVACSYWLRLKFENRTRKMPSDHGEGQKPKKTSTACTQTYADGYLGFRLGKPRNTTWEVGDKFVQIWTISEPSKTATCTFCKCFVEQRPRNTELLQEVCNLEATLPGSQCGFVWE